MKKIRVFKGLKEVFRESRIGLKTDRLQVIMEEFKDLKILITNRFKISDIPQTFLLTRLIGPLITYKLSIDMLSLKTNHPYKFFSTSIKIRTTIYQ